MEIYTIYCTKEQTKKAFELGAPIITISEPLYNHPTCGHNWVKVEVQGNNRSARIPTAEQMIGWLMEKNIYISSLKISPESKVSCTVVHNFKSEYEYFDAYADAVQWGINMALEYMEKEINVNQ